jgi:aspartyl-tRNA(Asn)/glutamyl-tRNA(Gln) amidotransferase subunit C
MSLTIKEVEHIADLAHLSLTDEEKQKYLKDLSRILEYVETLKAAPTAGVPLTSHVFPPRENQREDTVKPSLPRGELMQNAPQVTKDCFGIPRVIE